MPHSCRGITTVLMVLLLTGGCRPSATGDSGDQERPAKEVLSSSVRQQDVNETETALEDLPNRWRSSKVTDPPSSTAPSLRARPRATQIRAGGVRDINFDDLEFPIERDQDFQESMLTDEIRALEGKPVIIRGFILASSIFQQSGIKQFVLVRDNQECCFGPGAYVYHNIQIDMVPPATANFAVRPVTVEGKFSIRPWRAGGKCYSVFHIAAERVK